jgi:hypothetical protein
LQKLAGWWTPHKPIDFPALSPLGGKLLIQSLSSIVKKAFQEIDGSIAVVQVFFYLDKERKTWDGVHRDTHLETGDPARLPAQLAGRWGQRN